MGQEGRGFCVDISLIPKEPAASVDVNHDRFGALRIGSNVRSLLVDIEGLQDVIGTARIPLDRGRPMDIRSIYFFSLNTGSTTNADNQQATKPRFKRRHRHTLIRSTRSIPTAPSPLPRQDHPRNGAVQHPKSQGLRHQPCCVLEDARHIHPD